MEVVLSESGRGGENDDMASSSVGHHNSVLDNLRTDDHLFSGAS